MKRGPKRSVKYGTSQKDVISFMLEVCIKEQISVPDGIHEIVRAKNSSWSGKVRELYFLSGKSDFKKKKVREN